MCSIIDAGLAGLTAAVSTLADTHTAALTTTDRLAALTQLAVATRRLAAVENQLIAGLRRDASHAELGGSLPDTLARTLLLAPAEATRRIKDAEDTTSHLGVTGQTVAPRRPATAAALAAGTIDRTHVREIARFFTRIPAAIGHTDREQAEAFLAEQATGLRPDELRKAADHLLVYLGHDDQFSDTDRAQRRGFSWSHQDPDGISKSHPVRHPGPARRNRRRPGRLGRTRQMQPRR